VHTEDVELLEADPVERLERRSCVLLERERLRRVVGVAEAEAVRHDDEPLVGEGRGEPPIGAPRGKAAVQEHDRHPSLAQGPHVQVAVRGLDQVAPLEHPRRARYTVLNSRHQIRPFAVWAAGTVSCLEIA
jgi:hypothetical protein